MSRKSTVKDNSSKAETVTGGSAVYAALSLLFIIGTFYFYFFGRGLLIHQESNTLFIFSGEYLGKFVTRPGGLLVYAGSFLTQFYEATVTGAIIISVLITASGLIMLGILKALKASMTVIPLLIVLTSGTLMLFQVRYDFQAYHLLGFVIIMAWILVSLSARRKVSRLIIPGLFPLVFYVCGSFAFIFTIFYLVCNLMYLRGRSRWLPGFAFTAYMLVTLILFRNFLFFQTTGKLLLYPLFLNETIRLTMFLGFFSIWLTIVPAIVRFPLLLKKLPEGGSGSWLTSGALFAVLILLLVLHYDAVTDNVMKVEKMAQMQEWDNVIHEQEKLQSGNIVIQYYYNLALSEKGELCSRMFFAPQTSGAYALTLSRSDEQASRAMYFYYAIGLTGEAHHLAYESMVQHGYNPENIKMLIRTELINGHYKIAERYLNVLEKTLYYRRWAEKYKKMLYNSGLVTGDPELGREINLLPARDFFVVSDDFRNVENLLKDNTDNRIAFEYMIARMLLEKDIVEVGSQLGKFRDLGYESIPRHVEEAIVALVNATGKFPDMGGFAISKETDQRFLKYFSEMKSFRGDRKLIEKGMSRTERNTFWFYQQFGRMHTDFQETLPADNSIYGS